MLCEKNWVKNLVTVSPLSAAMKDGRHKRNELSRNHYYSCAKIVTAWMMLPLLRGLLLRVRLLFGPLLQLMLMLLFWEGLRGVAVDASIVPYCYG